MKGRQKAYTALQTGLLIILLFAGCANQTGQEKENASTTPQKETTTTKETQTTADPASTTTTRKTAAASTTSLPASKGLNESCALDADCETKCCAYLNGKHKCSDPETCKPKKTTQEECYSKQMNWCAGKCQKGTCGNCTQYTRCVIYKGKPMTESAEATPGREGSCQYSGELLSAGGEEGYCGQRKGEMIYAKCGSQPEAKDCAAAYDNPKGYTYRILSQRAFHAPGGEEYDLWCFMCERAG